MRRSKVIELTKRIHNKVNGLDYIMAGDYYILVIELLGNDIHAIGKWVRMHKGVLEENELDFT